MRLGDGRESAGTGRRVQGGRATSWRLLCGTLRMEGQWEAIAPEWGSSPTRFRWHKNHPDAQTGGCYESAHMKGRGPHKGSRSGTTWPLNPSFLASEELILAPQRRELSRLNSQGKTVPQEDRSVRLSVMVKK